MCNFMKTLVEVHHWTSCFYFGITSYTTLLSFVMPILHSHHARPISFKTSIPIPCSTSLPYTYFIGIWLRRVLDSPLISYIPYLVISYTSFSPYLSRADYLIRTITSAIYISPINFHCYSESLKVTELYYSRTLRIFNAIQNWSLSIALPSRLQKRPRRALTEDIFSQLYRIVSTRHSVAADLPEDKLIREIVVENSAQFPFLWTAAAGFLFSTCLRLPPSLCKASITALNSISYTRVKLLRPFVRSPFRPRYRSLRFSVAREIAFALTRRARTRQKPIESSFTIAYPFRERRPGLVSGVVVSMKHAPGHTHTHTHGHTYIGQAYRCRKTTKGKRQKNRGGAPCVCLDEAISRSNCTPAN